MVLSDTSASGTIPSELAQLPLLSILDLRGCRLTGPIPTELGALSSLEGLYVEDNRLTGSVPTELCPMLAALPPRLPLDMSTDCGSVSCPCPTGCPSC
jgi:hypothetical protein